MNKIWKNIFDKKIDTQANDYCSQILTKLKKHTCGCSCMTIEKFKT